MGFSQTKREREMRDYAMSKYYNNGWNEKEI